MRRSGAAGTEQTSSATSGVAPASAQTSAGCCICSPGRLASSPAAPCFHHCDLYPGGVGGTVPRPGKRGKEKEGWREKAGTSCSSRLVQAASRRQPKGMGNVCAALSGLHELYMTCYVKMLPVYCVSCSFLPPLFFSSLTPFLPPSSSLLSRAQSLLCFSATKYSLDVKC